MTRLLWILGFIAAFIVVVVLVGCAGITDTPPQDPPTVCRQYGFSHDGQDSSWVIPCPPGFGTANNALGARGME